MNTIRKSIVIGLTVLGLAGSTFAVQAQDASKPAVEQPHGKQHGHKHGHKHAGKHGDRAERQAQRAQKLHDALKLAPAQETAWASYMAAVKPQPRAERGVRGERPAKGTWKAMPAPERMEKRLAMAKKRLERMEARVAATSTFYATLSPEQKKLFDENSMGGGRHHRHHMKAGVQS